MAITIAINGFGRIGRQLTRLLCSEFGAGFELRAINSLETIDVAAHLLRYDSTHGPCRQAVRVLDHQLVIGERTVEFLSRPDTGLLPWRQMGIDLVIESSGQLTGREQAGLHLRAGAGKVLITAAAYSPDITLCMGVNHTAYQAPRHHIVSASSCTTNCLAPAAKLLSNRYGIRTSLATFLHSYTSSQHLLDLPGQDLRRMRAAGHNLIPTSTSAAQQVPLVIPELSGRFDAVAIRVPTPEVHLASFTAKLKTPTSRDELLELFREAAHGELNGILATSDAPLVSIDYQGTTPSCVLDDSTVMAMGDMIQLLIWHDNESSYCQRILDLVRYMASCRA